MSLCSSREVVENVQTRRAMLIVINRNSMLFSHHSPPFSSSASSTPFPLHVPSLWHRSAHRHSIRTPTAYRICFAYGPVSSAFLEQRVSGNGRADCYVVCADRGGC